jgi:hypothetical protein
MFIATLIRAALTAIIAAAFLVIAPTAYADCEFQGNQRTGSIDCIAWAGQQSQGSEREAGSTQTQGRQARSALPAPAPRGAAPPARRPAETARAEWFRAPP